MSVPAFDDLVQPITADMFVQSMISVAAQLGLPVTAWEPGSVGRMQIEVFATAAAEAFAQGNAAVRGGFLDTAVLEWLTFLADQQFDVQRVESSFAQGTLVLTNYSSVSVNVPAGSVRAYVAGPVTSLAGTFPEVRPQVAGASGKTFTSVTGGTVPVGFFDPYPKFFPGTLEVEVVADEPGPASNCPALYMTALVTPIQFVTCSNPDAIVANAEEGDEQLRDRCRASMARVTPNGPKDAYRYYATSAQLGGVSAGCTRVRVVQGGGSSVIWCASDSGGLSGSVASGGTPGSGPLGAVDDAVQANCVPTGLTATCASAVPLQVPVSLTVFLAASSTVTDDQAVQAVRSSEAALFRSVPVGGWDVPGVGTGLFQNNVEFAASVALPGQVVQVVVSSPPGNVPMAFNQVAVISGDVQVQVQRLQAGS